MSPINQYYFTPGSADVHSKLMGELANGTDCTPTHVTVVTTSCDKIHAFPAYSGEKELIFPPFLMKHEWKPLRLKAQDEEVTWFRPTSLDMLLSLKAEFPEARIIVGNTEVRP